MDLRSFWEDIEFFSDGTVKELWESIWYNMGIWKPGIILSGSDAPEYVIRTYSEGTFLFLQHKSGDYSSRGNEPHYYVFKKQP